VSQQNLSWNELDERQLTLFPEDFPVSHSALQENKKEKTMTVTSGQKCLELYQNSSPLGCLVRTLLVSSAWHSTRCALTWRIKVTKSNRFLFQLLVSPPTTKGNDALFWRTPSASDGEGGAMEMRANCSGHYKLRDHVLAKKQIILANSNSERGCLWENNRKDAEDVRKSPGREELRNWDVEPNVGRVANGVSARVHRLKCLGNAVVPQQVFPILKAIAEIERGYRGQNINS
jgi:hypothetical protein